jgi:hypothetical protein
MQLAKDGKKAKQLPKRVVMSLCTDESDNNCSGDDRSGNENPIVNVTSHQNKNQTHSDTETLQANVEARGGDP